MAAPHQKFANSRRLEQQFGRELLLPRWERTRDGTKRSAAICQRGVRSLPVHMIENIEGLSPEVELYPICIHCKLFMQT